MNVSLREITNDNFEACVKLKVTEDQKYFVATNVMSIAESKVSPHLIPLAVYNDDELVGFTLHGQDSQSKNYYIVRLMIDEKFQCKGFGKKCLHTCSGLETGKICQPGAHQNSHENNETSGKDKNYFLNQGDL